jgi:hypothetical protein
MARARLAVGANGESFEGRGAKIRAKLEALGAMHIEMDGRARYFVAEDMSPIVAAAPVITRISRTRLSRPARLWPACRGKSS